jgi:hypothetical protein
MVSRYFRSTFGFTFHHTVRHLVVISVILGSVSLALAQPVATTGAGAATTGTLPSNGHLTVGQSITSPNGQYKLALQGDGNLVEFDGSTAAWAAGTNPGGASAVMQGDGNFVVYSASNTPLWASNTSGNPGADLVLTDGGTLEVVSSTQVPLWAEPNVVLPNGHLTVGQSITSPNGQYKLALQGDGNLVEFDGSTAATLSSTAPRTHPCGPATPAGTQEPISS